MLWDLDFKSSPPASLFQGEEIKESYLIERDGILYKYAKAAAAKNKPISLKTTLIIWKFINVIIARSRAAIKAAKNPFQSERSRIPKTNSKIPCSKSMVSLGMMAGNQSGIYQIQSLGEIREETAAYKNTKAKPILNSSFAFRRKANSFTRGIY